MNNFLFLGGDLRLIYAAEKLNKRFDCFIYGQDDVEMPAAVRVPVLRETTKCRNLVLGLPSSRDGIHILAPNTVEKISFDIIPKVVEPGGTVFAGKVFPLLEEICRQNNNTLIDYFDREELAVMNAVPTAEGTLEILLRESRRTIFGMPILITGYGRITKVLVKHLVALGAKVTVAARKYQDLSWAEIMGCNAIHLSKLDGKIQEFDTIINTVPHIIFTADLTRKMKKGLLFVDLASTPGIEDSKMIEAYGIKVVWALSLPLKVMR